ncbi:MAG: lysoplasmalogenase family protein [Eubacteriales bacterium]
MKLNNVQKVLLAIYLPLTLAILLFDHIYTGVDLVNYLKYIVILTLCITALSIKKEKPEQKWMAASFLFIVFADIFLIFGANLAKLINPDSFGLNQIPFGPLGFLLAYLCLIAAFQKNFKLGRADVITATLITVICAVFLVSLLPYINGILLTGLLIFGIVLGYMVWTAICTVFRGYYKKSLAYIISLSASLMFICDLGVAFSNIHPAFAGHFVPWMQNVIWGSYVSGWMLLVFVISDDSHSRK